MRKFLILALAMVFIAGAAYAMTGMSPPAAHPSMFLAQGIDGNTLTGNIVENPAFVVQIMGLHNPSSISDGANLALCPAVLASAQNENLFGQTPVNVATAKKGWIRPAYSRVATAPMTSTTSSFSTSAYRARQRTNGLVC